MTRYLRACLGGSLVAAVGGLLTSSCASDDEAACSTETLDCAPIVSPPTFDAIYKNILAPSCASGNGVCHGNGGTAGRLDMNTVESAFQGLSSRVDPTNYACSTLIKRIDSPRASYRMPPGPTPLTAAQRCAIRQ